MINVSSTVLGPYNELLNKNEYEKLKYDFDGIVPGSYCISV